MITAAEIRNSSFERVKKGYDPETVDSLLDNAAQSVEQLQRDSAEHQRVIAELTAEKESFRREKSEMEQQMMLLADKVEEYREDEDKIRATLLGAQKMSDTILREAKQKADIMLRDASIKAERMQEASQAKIDREKSVLERLKQEVAKFKNDMLAIYKRHLDVLSTIPDYDLPETPAAEPETTQQGVVQPEPQPVAETEPVVEPEIVTEPEQAVPEDIVEPAEQPEEPQPESEHINEFVEQFDSARSESEAESDPEPESEVPAEQPPMKHEYTAADFSLDVEDEQKEPERSESSRFGKLDFGDDYSFDK